ncbi:MAG: TonB-dependent receptor [Rhodocyclaceae bacterium]|nr:TonB-dependent receptor [Rhodocyclaceae bacterium]
MSTTNCFPAVKPIVRMLGGLILSLSLSLSRQAEAATPVAPEVEVIATTPLPGLGLEREKIPAAVQAANLRDVKRSAALDVSDFLNRSLGSVHINEVQGNPFMNDVNYRGYTASPLLGTPQGLSVYLDGVRVNQPFGDVVMWDLIPKAAISSVTLMSGSNPLFGLNTLGGALSLQTRDGRHDPGTAVEAVPGSDGRRSLSIEHGGANDHGLDWFFTAHAYREEGWREDSPSHLGQFFGKLGWHDAKSELKLAYAWAGNRMNGNGSQEQQMLADAWSSIYTRPDTTENRAAFLNLEGKTDLGANLLLSGNVYYRNTRTATTNADLNQDAMGQPLYYTGQGVEQAWLSANGYGSPAAEPGSPGFPKWRCLAAAGMNGAPNELCNALQNNTDTHQENFGFSSQLSFFGAGRYGSHQGVLGAAYDTSRLHYLQRSRFGYLNPDRSVTPVGAWADGTQDSATAFDQRVDLAGRVATWSLYGSDTLSLHDAWHLTASARYNETRLKNNDNLYPYNNATTRGEQRGPLDGEHVFRRLNPALGLSYVPNQSINAYVGYSESSRAPTSIELGCADPNFGCRLPNSMAGDPVLKQVVSKTWEAGLRGRLSTRTHWNLGVFRGDNFDDILFVANSAATGYFRNFGQTRREGLEAGMSAVLDRLSLGLNYTRMKASYQNSDTLGSPFNSAADANGNIAIRPGDQIPLVPRQILKAHADYAFRPDLSADLEWVAVGGSYMRGNENNAQAPDGVGSFGSGRVPGYGVINFSGSYQPNLRLKLFARISNLLDRQYYTAGQLGPYAFSSAGIYLNSNGLGTGFYSPAAPRMVSVGLRYSFEKPTQE